MTTPNATASLSFAFKTALAQAVALASAFIAWPLHHSALLAILIATLFAYFAASFQALPLAWKFVNVALPVAAAINLSVEIPGWLFAAPLTLLLLTYAPALWTRVPYYPTPKAAYALILAELPTDKAFTFVDIGCGFGDLLTFLSQKRPMGRFIGIEVGPLPWFVANVKKTVLGRKNLTILYRDMWRFPLREIDIVYTFLSPAAMPRMGQKVSDEMKSGSTFITLSFPVPTTSDEVLSVKDARASKMYIHRIG